MKRIILLFTLVLLALPTYAQVKDNMTFTIDGEMKTGVLWEKTERIGVDPVEVIRLHNKDDAGSDQGRARLNFAYSYNNVGVKLRLNWENWGTTGSGPGWPYFFGYVNGFNDQLTVSIGKLGASPWGTGGPEEWKELEASGQGGGMRVEYKPDIAAAPWLKGLNVGFVLNWFEGNSDQGSKVDADLLDLLKESVIGFSYTHDYFLVRFAYRLDSELDGQGGNKDGDKLIYRAEERYLQTLLPGMQVWALGVYQGVGDAYYTNREYKNWLFAQYAPDLFTAQLRMGLIVSSPSPEENRYRFSLKPNFYLNLFDRMLSVGVAFMYENDFGKRLNDDAPFTTMEIEPKVQFNLNGGWIAFVYNWKEEYSTKEAAALRNPPINRFQYINLRFGMTF